jgi:hypothetical protein
MAEHDPDPAPENGGHRLGNQGDAHTRRHAGKEGRYCAGKDSAAGDTPEGASHAGRGGEESHADSLSSEGYRGAQYADRKD